MRFVPPESAIQIIWEIQSKPDRISEFERRYGPEGEWACLFRQSSGFRETLLAADIETPGRYLVTDIWTDLAAFHNFREEFSQQYQALDRACESLTMSEKPLGIFQYP